LTKVGQFLQHSSINSVVQEILKEGAMEAQWDVMKQRICRKCIDGNGKGNCRLPMNESCALEAFFPELIRVVRNVQSSSYEDYIAALRSDICSRCDHQMPDGTCRKRVSLECALDRYYPLVLDIIEEVAALPRAS
jgi:hypothetical protein